MCFSCRHYPIVSRNIGFEVCMEEQNEYDISTCVNRQLLERMHEPKRLSWADDLKSLQSNIASRARGVFLWASLMVPIVMKEYNKGKSLTDVLKTLKRIPSDLRSIYEHILQTLIDIEDRKDSLHLMQWICLAVKPLSLTELRYALALDDSVLHEIQSSPRDSEGFVEDDGRMKLLVTSLSGGLAEVRDHHDSNHVQFIHQSVNDFLLSGGFEWPGTECLVDFAGQGHHRVTRSCVNYLKLPEVQEIELLSFEDNERSNKQDLRRKVQRVPFLEYAVKSWSLHAEMAENKDIPQNDLIQRFEWPATRYFHRWIDLFLVTDEDNHRCPGRFATLLHISAASNLRSITHELLLGENISEKYDLEGNSALHYVAQFGHNDIVRMLLDAKANPKAKNLERYTALERATSAGHLSTMALLIESGADVNGNGDSSTNALHIAASNGSYLATRLLLSKGADIHAKGGRYGNALQAAAYTGDESVVKLLLDKGADVHAQGGRYGNALQAAAYAGDESIVKVLLDKGADVHAQGGLYGSALQAAIYMGNESVFKLLLDKGADIFGQDKQGRYPYQLAIRGTHHEMIDLVLAKIGTPDWDYQDLQGCSALHFAASSEFSWILQLILKSDININLLDTYGWTPLHWASRGGRSKIVQILLDAGADPNRKDIKGWTPLNVAIFCRHRHLIPHFPDYMDQLNPVQLIPGPGNKHNEFSCGSCYHVSLSW
jgi:ankyrin repeat domain-containing protein 50